jgi:hypothetical protein
LPAILTSKRSPYNSVASKREKHQNDQQYSQQPSELFYQKHNPPDQWKNENHHVRYYFTPGNLTLGEVLRIAFLEQPGTQPAFAQPAYFAIIMAMNAAALKHTDFKPETVQQIKDSKRDTESAYDICPKAVEQNRDSIGQKDYLDRKVLINSGFYVHLFSSPRHPGGANGATKFGPAPL